jgi:hypothetical protein
MGKILDYLFEWWWLKNTINDIIYT